MTQTTTRSNSAFPDDDEPAARVADEALDRAVATAWRTLVEAADAAERETGEPARIDVSPSAWIDDSDSRAQAIGRVLLRASIDAERLRVRPAVAPGASPPPTAEPHGWETLTPAAEPPTEATAVVPVVPVVRTDTDERDRETTPVEVVAPMLWPRGIQLEPVTAVAPTVAPAPAPTPDPTIMRPVPAPPASPAPQSAPAFGAAPGIAPFRSGLAARVRPVAWPEGLSRRRIAIATGLSWVVGAAVIALLFVAYQLWGTGIAEAHAQDHLKSEFQSALAHAPAATGPTTVTKLIVDPTPPPLPGGVVGEIEIKAINLDKFIVEGTGRSDLQKGPGHYSGSSLPGHPGNAAIAGHRTTYGAPFNRLDELKVGDKILVRTAEGSFSYTVSQAPFPVSPSNSTVVQDYGDNRLTLTTCNPKFSAAQRLIVVAKFDGAVPKSRKVTIVKPGTKVAAKTPALAPSHVAVGASDGWGGGATLPVLGWTVVIVALGLAHRPLRRHWPLVAVYVVLVPLWGSVLWLFLEQLNRLLPANV